MKKLKENNTFIHITWNNSWRKWNSKRLLSSRSRPAKVSSSDQHRISKKQYRRCSYRYRFGIHAKSARCAAGWRAIHRDAIPVDVCGKKELLDLVCVPLCIFPGVRDQKENKSIVPLISQICYLAALSFERRGVLEIVCMVYRDYFFRLFYAFAYALT